MSKRKRRRVGSSERKRLELDQQRTQAEMVRLRSSVESELEPSRAGEDGDAADVASDIYEREKALALIRTLELKLEAIDRALEHADQGTYGICEQCGERIEPERLDIVPEATMCVKCKNLTEQGGRGRRRPVPSRLSDDEADDDD